MKNGKALIADMDTTHVTHGDAVFWWLGQHSFVVKTCDAVLYFDPYLSDNPKRQVAPLLRPEEATNAMVVLGSHDHGDHIDRPAFAGMASASPAACFIVPPIALTPLVEAGVPESHLVPLDAEEAWETESMLVTAIPAAHEFFDHDEVTGHPYLGFIVESGGVRIYHAGDTVKYEGLETRLKQQPIDLAFLPVNGRDARRLTAGCIGNMTYQEAADLAGAIGPGLTVPAHFEMFATNSEDPQLFVDYMAVKYPHLAVWTGGHGKAARLSELRHDA